MLLDSLSGRHLVRGSCPGGSSSGWRSLAHWWCGRRCCWQMSRQGNLDSATAAEILQLLGELQVQHGATLVIATHDPAIAATCDVVLEVRDGQVHPQASYAG